MPLDQPLEVSFLIILKRIAHVPCICDKESWSVVTKLQSNSFSQAWCKAIRPELIVCGFRNTGICPLNKNAIKIAQPSSTSEEEPSSSEMEAMSSTSEEGQNNSACHTQAEDPEASVNNTIPEPNFTEEQFAFFERFENVYDLYVDQDYVAWLWLYHPNSLPEQLSSAESATSNVKSSGLEGEMELSVLSHESPIQSTPIRDQDEPLDVSESPI